jgi:hypothetical protein
MGLFGHIVITRTDEMVTVDEPYVRESILQPSANVAADYQPLSQRFRASSPKNSCLRLSRVKSLKAPGVPTAILIPIITASAEANR